MMSKYLLILGTLMLFTACKNNDGPSINDIPTMDTLATEKMYEQEQLEQIKMWEQKLTGEWYSEAYLNEIKFNLSPYKSSSSKIELVGIRFDKPMKLSEKKIKVITFDLHEGKDPAEFYVSDFKLHFNLPTGKTYTMLEVNEKEFIAEEAKSGKVITFYKYPNLATGIANILLNGTYEIQESGRVISFNSNGTIKDWPSFDYYEIAYDFVGLTEWDCILFSKKPDAPLTDKVLYRAVFTPSIITLTKYNPDWTNLNHEATKEILHLKKR